jgi:histidyl-tRNA synthetase
MLLDGVPAEKRPIAIIPVGEAAELPALKLTQELRRAGFIVDLGYGGNTGKRMKRANKINARAALILGEDELARGAVMLRDLDGGEQHEVALVDVAEKLAPFR